MNDAPPSEAIRKFCFTLVKAERNALIEGASTGEIIFELKWSANQLESQLRTIEEEKRKAAIPYPK